MKWLAIALLSISINCSASIIHNPSDYQCKAFSVFKESRGESKKAMRAVLDVIESRERLSGQDACTVLRVKGAFPYMRHGVKKVPKEWLTTYDEVVRMDVVVPESVRFFGHVRMNKKDYELYKKIGKLYFYSLREK